MADDIVNKGLESLTGAVKTAQTAISNLPGAIDRALKFQPRLVGVSKGAVPFKPSPAAPTFNGKQDLRVKLLVPDSYLVRRSQPDLNFSTEDGPVTVVQSSQKNVLSDAGGIIFPYTPQITHEQSAEYSSQNPVHSNYSLYFYKNSKVGQIQLTARFTVQNINDAKIWLETLSLLRSLTKMKFGQDQDAGTPPPICKLQAYGNGMLNNIPVVVSTFRTELGYDVEYFYFEDSFFGSNMIPVAQTLTMTLLPVYSRTELSKFSTDSFINGEYLGKGFL